jgi:uncharacterized protein
VELRPEAWQKLLNADADTAAAMRGMMALADVVCRDQHLPRKELDTINATAPDNIARWVPTLNDWRLANYQPMQGIDPRVSSASTKKAGRNDPCPCGSGKKYKKCCGLN